MLLIQFGFITAQTKTMVTVYGEKVQINPNPLTTANNGLSATGGNVQLGGTLTLPTTTITTSTGNTLAISGLQPSVSGTDNLIVADPATGVLKKMNPSTLNNVWLLKGNAGTTANPTSTSSNFVGTTDNMALNFRINNTYAGWIGTQTGGPGTSSVYFGFNTGLAAAPITNAAYSNIGIGDNALALNTSNGNIGIGAYALTKSVSGNNNIAMGLYAVQNNTSGSSNIGIGATALQKNTTGSFNIGLGSNTGLINTTGSNNIFIGNSADTSTDALSNAIAIGYGAKVGQSNSLILGGTGANSVKVGIGNTAPTNTLHVTGIANPVRFEGLQTSVTPATDLVVMADATGVLKTVASSTMVVEPWQVQSTTNKATANTDDIYQTGRVAIGTNSMLGTADSNVKLAVNGSIITPTSYYADYVFEDYLDGKSDIKSEYSFKSLDEVEKFITKNKHLPGVTSIKDLQRNEKGEYIFNITDLSIQSLEKIEELYLHTIEQKKQLDANEKNIDDQKKQLEANEKTIKAMSDRIDSLEKLIRENIK